VENVIGVIDRGQDLVIVQDSDFPAFNVHPRTGITAKDDPIAFLAPRTLWELGGIGVSQWSNGQNVRTSRS
jgi:hypothetical protein